MNKRGEVASLCGAVMVLALAIRACGKVQHAKVEQSIKDKLATKGMALTSLTCPDRPIKKGDTFVVAREAVHDCQALAVKTAESLLLNAHRNHASEQIPVQTRRRLPAELCPPASPQRLRRKRANMRDHGRNRGGVHHRWGHGYGRRAKSFIRTLDPVECLGYFRHAGYKPL